MSGPSVSFSGKSAGMSLADSRFTYVCVSYGAQPYPKIRNKEIRRVVKKGLRLPRPQVS